MKKKYIAPTSYAFEMQAEQMIATSGVNVDPSKNIDFNNEAVYSDKSGWSSDNWSE